MNEHIVCWNVRGLNRRAHRSMVRELDRSKKAYLLCLQEML
jgi:exonuclease III